MSANDATVLARRVIVVAALLVAVVAGYVLLRGGSPYEIHARFQDAGQLVHGATVQVAGRSVGRITALEVTPDGQADVKLRIDDHRFVPLHRGTRATLRAIGQAGVANRYVDISPGPRRAPAMANGAVLGTQYTTGIVDLDAVLDAIGPQQRNELKQIIGHTDEVFAGSQSARFNRVLAQLSPTFAATDRLTSDVAADSRQLGTLVRAGATAASTVASRQAQVRGAVDHAAVALRAIAAERGALGGTLQRAPALLAQARQTLGDVGRTADAVTPALRDVPPAARTATPFLRTLTPALDDSRPTIARLDSLLPDLRQGLGGLSPLKAPLIEALGAVRGALTDVKPITAGLREYGADLILGVFNGLAGIASGNYDATGHYVRLEFAQTPQTLLGGTAGDLLASQPLIPGLIGIRTHLYAQCPGGTAPPAPDGSNPYIPDPKLCNPADGLQPSVNGK